MYAIYAYIGVVLEVNVGIYGTHGVSGIHKAWEAEAFAQSKGLASLLVGGAPSSGGGDGTSDAEDGAGELGDAESNLTSLLNHHVYLLSSGRCLPRSGRESG